MSEYKIRPWYKDQYDTLKDWVFMTIIIGAIIGVFVLAFGIALWGSKVTCEHKADDMGLEWKWTIFSGCLVQVDGSWAPLDKLRFADIVRE